jgi:hypothetical protein
MEIVEETGDATLVDIVKRQNVIQKVIGPSLREGVELDIQGEAMRWFPLRGSKAIVFDPARKFGQPILAEYDIPTIAISDRERRRRERKTGCQTIRDSAFGCTQGPRV